VISKQDKADQDFIDLEQILDPYERMKGGYYLVEIVKAEHCRQGSTEYSFLALEFIVIEQQDTHEKERCRFAGRKLYMNVSFHPKRIWLVKHLCNAVNVSGKHTPEKLAELLVGHKVLARVIPEYNHDFELYFHNINRFKPAP